MTWPTPLYNRGRVDAAGRQLIDPTVSDQDFDVALEIINNWRSAHSYPLLALRVTLHKRARRIDSNAVVAQRLKKLTSIETKLRRNPHMQLSQMQDIGGCRAVLATADHVGKLVDLYRESDTKNPSRSKRARDPYDYVACPKKDGYRSIHLVYKYQSNSLIHRIYNGQRIEIQIRSRLQHAWATTVEVVDTITREAIKTGGGDPNWRQFFALISSAMAIVERRPRVPDAPSDRGELNAEIIRLADLLQVEKRLQAYVVSVRADQIVAGKTFLLNLDLDTQEVHVQAFAEKETPEASAAYLAAEKANAGRPNRNAVLVTLDGLKNLRAAYPNYYLDTRQFLRFLAKIRQRGQR